MLYEYIITCSTGIWNACFIQLLRVIL